MGNRIRMKTLKERLTHAQHQRRVRRIARRAALNPMKTLEGSLK